MRPTIHSSHRGIIDLFAFFHGQETREKQISGNPKYLGSHSSRCDGILHTRVYLSTVARVFLVLRSGGSYVIRLVAVGRVVLTFRYPQQEIQLMPGV